MRLRARFGGKMVAAVAILLAAAAVVSFLVYQQGMVLAKDFYIIGVSSGAPALDDQRFHIMQLDQGAADYALKGHKIDAYLTGKTIYYRDDDRSQYAAGAVKTYLRTGELQRVAAEYPLNQAFPLRVEVNYLKAPSKALGSASVVTVADIMGGTGKSGTQEGKSIPLEADSTENAQGGSHAPGPVIVDESDASVRQQLAGLGSAKSLPEFKAEFASNKEVIVPIVDDPAYTSGPGAAGFRLYPAYLLHQHLFHQRLH